MGVITSSALSQLSWRHIALNASSLSYKSDNNIKLIEYGTNAHDAKFIPMVINIFWKFCQSINSVLIKAAISSSGSGILSIYNILFRSSLALPPNWESNSSLDNTVYPKKYAHGFCFAVLYCGYTLTDFPISIRLTSLALWQSNDCPSASKATLMNMDKYFMWIHYERSIA